MRDAVLDTLRELARRELQRDEVPTGELAEHLDSVERLTLVVAIEDHFEIVFDPSEEEEVHTLADVAALVGRKLAERDDG